MSAPLRSEEVDVRCPHAADAGIGCEDAVRSGLVAGTGTGRDAWRADEVLPHFFFEKLRNELACDAVLFTHLASYHAYEPIVLGWAMKLVDGQNTQVLWAADEVFDAGRQPVAQAAEGFGQTFRERWFHSSNQEGVLLSPRLFGQYTLGALFATLPEASR